MEPWSRKGTIAFAADDLVPQLVVMEGRSRAGQAEARAHGRRAWHAANARLPSAVWRALDLCRRVAAAIVHGEREQSAPALWRAQPGLLSEGQHKRLRGQGPALLRYCRPYRHYDRR